VYSPGQSKYKKAIVIISAIVMLPSSRTWPYAWAKIKSMMMMGIGLTRFGGESSFLYARSWRPIRKSISPKASLRTSGDPNLANV
jgi:hypothetical protein